MEGDEIPLRPIDSQNGNSASVVASSQGEIAIAVNAQSDTGTIKVTKEFEISTMEYR